MTTREPSLRRVGALPAYLFSVIDELKAGIAADGGDVIDFGIGSPDRPTPDPVVERLCAAARDPAEHGYPTSAGTPELREALAAWYRRRFAVSVDPARQTLVTWGASEALAHLPWVLLQSGDTALVPDPCYPIHRFAVQFAGATPLPLPIAADNDIAAGAERVWARAEPRPRVAVLSFPHNPTTRCLELADLERLVAFAHRREVFLVHDFTYADIAFDGYRPPSILQVPGADEVAVEIVSLSKSHNMAGWRLGFVAGNATVVGGLERLKSYLDYGVTKPVQRMATAALTECDDVPVRMAAIYERRRDRLCGGLTAAGWPVARPRGTMFVWAALPAAWREAGSLAFATALLREAQVAVSPGVGFGASGDGHVRFALVQPEARIDEAIARIAPLLERGAR